MNPLAWMDAAACATAPQGLMHSGDTHTALRYCARCPVTRSCLDFAMTNEPSAGTIRHRTGIYGGTTPKQRAQLAQENDE